MKVDIQPLTVEHVPAIKVFTDLWIGNNYYDDAEILDLLEGGEKKGIQASLGAWVSDELVGVRLTLAPGELMRFIKRGLSPEAWPCSEDKMAYFKSLFVAEGFQGQGIGRQLSELSLQYLKEQGAEAVMCHSWLESPGNSSQKYLQKMDFKEVAQHPKFWFPIDYECTRCAPEKCVCTASEMVKELV